MRDLGFSGVDQQERLRAFSLAHQDPARRCIQRAQLRRQRHQSIRPAALEDLQGREFVGADGGQSGHVTRLPPQTPGAEILVASDRPRNTSLPFPVQCLLSASSARSMAADEQRILRSEVFARSASRAASLTGSPITVYSYRFSAPMFPANTAPAETPIPKSTWRSSRNCSPSVRAVANAAAAAPSDRNGAPNTASAASPWNLLIIPSRASTALTTMLKNSLSTSATCCGGGGGARARPPFRSGERKAP